jgi:predicted membrane protein
MNFVMKSAWIFLGGFLLLVPVFLFGQDFEKNYNLPPAGTISIDSVSGDIAVSGYAGTSIHVKAVKEGHDKDKVQVVDNSSSNRLELKAEYPHQGECDASIRFIVEVPSDTEYSFDALSTASGDISVTGVKGTVHIRSASGDISGAQVRGKLVVSTASGDVKLDRISGSVEAKSVSGDVEVNLEQLSGSDPLSFKSVSGDVVVVAPSTLDAEIEMKSMSGDLNTDFPLTIQSAQFGPQKGATGRIGQGTHKIEIKTVSGDVRLKKPS